MGRVLLPLQLLVLQASLGLWLRHSSLVSLPHGPSLCLRLCVSYKDTRHWVIQGDLIQEPHLITSAKTFSLKCSGG